MDHDRRTNAASIRLSSDVRRGGSVASVGVIVQPREFKRPDRGVHGSPRSELMSTWKVVAYRRLPDFRLCIENTEETGGKQGGNKGGQLPISREAQRTVGNVQTAGA